MNRAFANHDIPPVECTNYILDLWRIRWDYQPVIDPDNPDSDLVSFLEYQFNHKPSLQEVKEVIGDDTHFEWDIYKAHL